MLDGKIFFTGTDDRLDRIGEVGHDIELKRGLPGIGAETAGRIRDTGAGKLADHPAPELLDKIGIALPIIWLVGVIVIQIYKRSK